MVSSRKILECNDYHHHGPKLQTRLLYYDYMHGGAHSQTSMLYDNESTLF